MRVIYDFTVCQFETVWERKVATSGGQRTITATDNTTGRHYYNFYYP